MDFGSCSTFTRVMVGKFAAFYSGANSPPGINSPHFLRSLNHVATDADEIVAAWQPPVVQIQSAVLLGQRSLLATPRRSRTQPWSFHHPSILTTMPIWSASRPLSAQLPTSITVIPTKISAWWDEFVQSAQPAYTDPMAWPSCSLIAFGPGSPV